MLDNTVSYALVAGFRGADHAQRLVSPASWARQLFDASMSAQNAALDGARDSLHARSVDATQKLYRSAWFRGMSFGLDAILGSGVHAPLTRPHALERPRPNRLMPDDHKTCQKSLMRRFDAMTERPETVGLFGLGVGLMQMVPGTLGCVAGAAGGAVLGGIFDVIGKRYCVRAGHAYRGNATRACTSWGAYLGAGAGVLAAATVLTVGISSPTLAGAAVVIWAPNCYLQGLRGLSVGLRVGAVGAAYGVALFCCTASDAWIRLTS